MKKNDKAVDNECPVLAAISLSAAKGEEAACELMKILYWSVEESKITIEQASEAMVQDLKQIKQICGPCICPYSQAVPVYRNGYKVPSVYDRVKNEEK